MQKILKLFSVLWFLLYPDPYHLIEIRIRILIKQFFLYRFRSREMIRNLRIRIRNTAGTGTYNNSHCIKLVIFCQIFRTIQEFKRHVLVKHKEKDKECIYIGCSFSATNSATYRVNIDNIIFWAKCTYIVTSVAELSWSLSEPVLIGRSWSRIRIFKAAGSGPILRRTAGSGFTEKWMRIRSPGCPDVFLSYCNIFFPF